MILESGTTYRSLAAQKDFSFYLRTILSNTSGISSIGLSGDNNFLELFNYTSGKIIDFNKNYVWSYNPREIIDISGNITSGYLNYFINNSPVCIFSPVPLKYYDNFYFSTKNSTIDVNFFIQGQIPNYTFKFPLNTQINQNVTGFIFNNNITENRSFKIFTGDIFTTNVDYTLNNYPLNTLSGQKSGQIILKPNFDNIAPISEPVESDIFLVFDTNFGKIIENITFNVTPVPVYYTDFITGFTGNLGFLQDRSLYRLYNYELKSLYPIDRNFSFILENVSGHTGQQILEQFSITGDAAGIVSGFIYGFNYITGNVLGTGYSVIKDYFGNTLTGKIDINYKALRYATGNINYYYNLPLFGSGTGKSPEGTIIPASGIISANNLSGFIFGRSLFSTPNIINLEGYYYNSLNTGQGIFEILNFNLVYTGNYNINFNDYFWKSTKVTGIGYTGIGNLIYPVRGDLNGITTNTNSSGTILINSTFYSNQTTGNLLSRIVKQNSGVFINSGSAFASENDSLVKNAFTGDNYFYLTGHNSFIRYYLNGYSNIDKKNITHYSFDVDFNTKQQPYIFKLQLSDQINPLGASWITIDTITGADFYTSSPKIFACKNPINNTSYENIRILIESSINWQHKFSGALSISGIGIRNLEFYSSLPIHTVGNGEIFRRNLVPHNINNYNFTGILIPEDAISGYVFNSTDNPSRPAWNAFNTNKTLYPYAELIDNDSEEIFLGYAFSGEGVKLSGFNIEFETGFTPQIFRIEGSNDNQNYTTLIQFNPFNNTILSGNIGSIQNQNFYKYIRYKFKDFPTCTVIPPESVDTNSSCYLQVITNEPFCCNGFSWDSICQNLYNICSFGSSSSSSSLTSSSSSTSLSSSSSSTSLSSSSSSTSLFCFDKWLLKKKFYKEEIFAEELFGTAIDTNSNASLIVIGVPGYNLDSGLVSLYTGNSITGWNLAQNITGSGQSTFGKSVAVNPNGNVIVVGSPQETINGLFNVGSATIFTGNNLLGWNFKQKLTGDNIFNKYGTTLAINENGNTIVMGGPAYGNGAALIYTGNSIAGWEFRQKLTGDSVNDFFGNAISINNNGTTIVVGSYQDDPDNQTNAGSVMIFTGNANVGWTLKQKITGENPNINVGFGTSVDINGDASVIGVGTRTNGTYPFTFNIFTGNPFLGWELKQKISGENIYDSLGASISINNNGNTIIVGSPGSDVSGVTDAGAAFVFTGNANGGWYLQDKIVPTILGEYGNEYGNPVKINKNGNVVLIGGPYDGTVEFNGGGVFGYVNPCFNESLEVFGKIGMLQNEGCGIHVGGDLVFNDINNSPLTGYIKYRNCFTSGNFVQDFDPCITIPPFIPSGISSSSSNSNINPEPTVNNYWNFINISSGGQYQMVVRNYNPPFISQDFGKSWFAPADLWLNQDLTSIILPKGAMSSNGQYQIFASRNGKLMYSSDFGSTWSLKTIGRIIDFSGKLMIYPRLPYNCDDFSVCESPISDFRIKSNWRYNYECVDISDDGKYITTVVGSPFRTTGFEPVANQDPRYPLSFDTGSLYTRPSLLGTICVSSDSGNTWEFKAGAQPLYPQCKISRNGQVQVVGGVTMQLWGSGIESSQEARCSPLFISNDYGNNWRKFVVPYVDDLQCAGPNSFITSLSGGMWTSAIGMSFNGKDIMIGKLRVGNILNPFPPPDFVGDVGIAVSRTSGATWSRSFLQTSEGFIPGDSRSNWRKIVFAGKYVAALYDDKVYYSENFGLRFGYTRHVKGLYKDAALSNDGKYFILLETTGANSHLNIPNSDSRILDLSYYLVGKFTNYLSISGKNSSLFGSTFDIPERGAPMNAATELIIGASNDVSNNVGAVYVYYDNYTASNGVTYNNNPLYKWDNSFVNQKITGDGNFGYSLECNDRGTVLAVGAPNKSLGGAVSIYSRTQTLDPFTLKTFITGHPLSEFGFSVSTNKSQLSQNDDNELIAVGAPRDNSVILGGGAAYIYKNAGEEWTFYSKLTGDSHQRLFGSEIKFLNTPSALSVESIPGNNIKTLVIGAPADNQNGPNAGAIFIYTGNLNKGWSLNQKITGSPLSRFGSKIDIRYVENDGPIFDGSGNYFFYNQKSLSTIAVGAPNDNNRGAVYIFTGNPFIKWSLNQKLTGLQVNSEFGSSLSISPPSLLYIGAPKESILSQSNVGKVYGYYKFGPNYQLAHVLSGSKANMYFGTTIKGGRVFRSFPATLTIGSSGDSNVNLYRMDYKFNL